MVYRVCSTQLLNDNLTNPESITRRRYHYRNFAPFSLCHANVIPPDLQDRQISQWLSVLASLSGEKHLHTPQRARSTRQGKQQGLTAIIHTTITTITLTLPSIGHREEGVELRIYDPSGRLIKSIPLITNHMSLGTKLKPDVYFLRVEGCEPLKVVKLK